MALITKYRKLQSRHARLLSILESAVMNEEGNWDGPYKEGDDNTEAAWMASARAAIEDEKKELPSCNSIN
jgi:hypothetical protein